MHGSCQQTDCKNKQQSSFCVAWHWSVECHSGRWEKRKKECKNSFQFMDFMCTCKEMHIHQVSCYMYCRCTKQKECRFLRWGYKVCISQQESRQMFLVLSLSLLLFLLLHHKFTNFKSILFLHFFFFFY